MNPATLLISTIDAMRRRRFARALLASGWERVRIRRNGRMRWHWRLKRRPGGDFSYLPEPGELVLFDLDHRASWRSTDGGATP